MPNSSMPVIDGYVGVESFSNTVPLPHGLAEPYNTYPVSCIIGLQVMVPDVADEITVIDGMGNQRVLKSNGSTDPIFINSLIYIMETGTNVDPSNLLVLFGDRRL